MLVSCNNLFLSSSDINAFGTSFSILNVISGILSPPELKFAFDFLSSLVLNGDSFLLRPRFSFTGS